MIHSLCSEALPLKMSPMHNVGLILWDPERLVWRGKSLRPLKRVSMGKLVVLLVGFTLFAIYWVLRSLWLGKRA